MNTPTNTYCPFEGTPMHKLLIDGYHYDTIGTGGWSNVPARRKLQYDDDVSSGKRRSDL